MTTQQTMKITGMTCASCANRIEKGLKKVPGVSDVNVNFSLETATVSYDASQTDVSELEAKISSLGYGTVKETVELKLTGMTCAACANRIEKGLNKLLGVTKATVNFALETAHVEYSPNEVQTKDMIQKVE